MGDGAVGRFHLHHVAGLQRAVPLGPRDLVLLEEELDPLGVLGDDLRFARHHGGEVNRCPLNPDAVLGRVEAQPFVLLGALQQGLGGNAPHIHARTTKRVVEFDARHGEAELCGAD